MAGTSGNDSITRHLRKDSVSAMNANSSLGMWRATSAAIAQAPNLAQLRQPELGRANIKFTAHALSVRTAVERPQRQLFPVGWSAMAPVEDTLGRERWALKSNSRWMLLDQGRRMSEQLFMETT